jgi:5-methylcytosine-specific restriction endonuclease McrA
MAKKKDARGRVRDYAKEYARDHASKAAKKARAKRNNAAKRMKCAKGQEVDHKKPLSKGGSNKKSNLRCVSRRVNRQKGAKR